MFKSQLQNTIHVEYNFKKFHEMSLTITIYMHSNTTSGRVSSPDALFWRTMTSITFLSLTLMKLSCDLYRFHREMTTFTEWFGPHRQSLPLPRIPVRPLGFLQVHSNSMTSDTLISKHNAKQYTPL
jgi:hypothetical protein